MSGWAIHALSLWSLLVLIDSVFFLSLDTIWLTLLGLARHGHKSLR